MCIPMRRAGVRADGALGVATALAQAGAGRGFGLDPSTAERRCSAAVAPPPPWPLLRVAVQQRHVVEGSESEIFYLINR
jgi:hypothetical protein